MFSKTLKLVGLIGGGILALGTGAVGSHLAQPHLEPLLNPERKEREDRLQESLEETQDEIEILNRGLSESVQTGELQSTRIENLEGEVKDLQGQVKTKTEELSSKDVLLNEKNTEIKKYEDLNSEQATNITNLKKSLQNKEEELSNETKEKKKIEDELEGINKKLLLTRDDILTEQAIKEGSLKVNLKSVKLQSVNGGVTTFKADDYDNKSKTIQIKSDKFPNHEEIAKQIRSKGITFKLHQDFANWEKVVHTQLYGINYDYKPTKETEKIYFSEEKETKVISLSEYFKEEYLEDAFRVLLAISFLDLFPLCHDLSAKGTDKKPFLFCEERRIKQDFFSETPQRWDAFTEKDKKFGVFINSFVTIEDFIKYWTQKTVDFVRTGTVDLLDFMNPMLFSKNYQLQSG